jgi:hypothetical protein
MSNVRTQAHPYGASGASDDDGTRRGPRAPILSRTSRLATLFMVTMIVIIAWLAAIAWRERELTSAVRDLPADVQQATFRRSYDELATTCATQPQLADHCSNVAQFVLRFPQCGPDCQELARRYFPVVTR